MPGKNARGFPGIDTLRLPVQPLMKQSVGQTTEFGYNLTVFRPQLFSTEDAGPDEAHRVFKGITQVGCIAAL